MAELKPMVAWALVNKRGNIYPYVLSSTRRGAIAGFCDSAVDPDALWAKYRKQGWRAMKVHILTTAGATHES